MSPESIFMSLAAMFVVIAYFFFGGRLLKRLWWLLLVPVLGMFLLGLFFYVVANADSSCDIQISDNSSCGIGDGIFVVGGMFLMAGSFIAACIGSLIAYYSASSKIKASSLKK